jgi:predicted nucleic acid-binding protein
MIVVDTNILAYLYLPGEYTALAEDLLETTDAWAVPILWRSEFRNILAGCLRRNELSFENAIALQLEAESLVAGNEYEVDSRKILELVRDSNCSAYDCEFVALALSLNTRVVTADKKILQAFPDTVISLRAG